MSATRMLMGLAVGGLACLAMSCGLSSSSRETQTLDAVSLDENWEILTRRAAEPGGGRSMALASMSGEVATGLDSLLQDPGQIETRFDVFAQTRSLGGGVLRGFPEGCYIFVNLVGSDFAERPERWPPSASVVVSAFCDGVELK